MQGSSRRGRRIVSGNRRHRNTSSGAAQEFGLALDRQAMADTILAGAGTPAYGPVSPDTGWHDPEVTGGGPDPAAAGKLLDEAGSAARGGGRRGAVRLGRPARSMPLYESTL
ncbi:ABC transporter substrate-binding protein [Streptosporangium sp. NPDC023825]|uniref:ABC transporter substrate-binding protein n=1 Tax=Streptosporangium sp. NPDC023825 TaxID=3154909 RepID=UPI003420586E